jgi:taurine dioxygenase
LQEYVTRPENTVRWHWRAGDVAIWDNRSTQHCAVVDYGDAYRRLERVTVAGSTPIGVDGRPGVSLKGDASVFYAGGGSS